MALTKDTARANMDLALQHGHPAVRDLSPIDKLGGYTFKQRRALDAFDAEINAACKDILDGGDPVAARRRMEAAASEHGADLPLIGVPVRDGHGYVMRLAVSA